MNIQRVEAAKQRARKLSAAAERVDEAKERERELTAMFSALSVLDPTTISVHFKTNGKDQTLQFDNNTSAAILQRAVMEIVSKEILYARIRRQETEMELLTK